MSARDQFADNIRIDAGSIAIETSSKTDITDKDFFLQTSFFQLNNSQYWAPTSLDFTPMSQWVDYPDLAPTVDMFAKVLYSLILSDFGQAGQSNGLIHEDDLQYILFWMSNYTHEDGGTDGQDLQGYALNQSYDALKDTMPPLQVNPVTLFLEYTCSVPRRRGIGSVIIAVLAADLVFLRALWTIATWLTSLWLTHKYPQSKLCYCCDDSIRTQQPSENGQPIASQHTQHKPSPTYQLVPLREENVTNLPEG
ncbi:hypothetical protein H2200_008554 [Cladophialophora chaetospira]|uniref:Uncharacterized protein n=1 Tax=Cladophialophora chaetospira TaxID=386627 RepID=A0AA38X4A4_9EURO|nr:hypothetical protein H2200_008554 [Cladophialophora chaetospira]